MFVCVGPVIINGFGMCYMFKCLCVWLLWPVIINVFGICYMINVCVCVASDH